MSALLGDVATHVVRQHRNLRRRLPDLRRLAHDAPDGDPRRRHRAAQAAVRFLDRDVLAHADVEDAVLDDVCAGSMACGELNRLRPSHDTVRDADARLRAFVDQPDDRLQLPGFLLALHDLLVVHLDDEWRTLVPLFVDADERGIARLQDRYPAGLDRPASGAIRSYVPTAYEELVQRMRGRDLDVVARRLARAAQAAVRRAARSDALPLRDDLDLRLVLRPVVSSPHVTLIVGRLTSAELETVVAPVDVEITLTPGGPDGQWAMLELNHTLMTRRRLPSQAPAHDLTEIAIHAIVGELASCVDRRSIYGRTSPI